MEILKNSTEGIYPYRENVFRKGEMTMYIAKPRSGKSMIYNTNLCKEIVFSMPATMCILGFPETSESLKKLMPKYKFSRANWYVAEYDWVHHAEVLDWCKQQFGPHPQQPDAWSRWHNKYSDRIHFSNEKDYQWFLLRWGV